PLKEEEEDDIQEHVTGSSQAEPRSMTPPPAVSSAMPSYVVDPALLSTVETLSTLCEHQKTVIEKLSTKIEQMEQDHSDYVSKAQLEFNNLQEYVGKLANEFLVMRNKVIASEPKRTPPQATSSSLPSSSTSSSVTSSLEPPPTTEEAPRQGRQSVGHPAPAFSTLSDIVFPQPSFTSGHAQQTPFTPFEFGGKF
ncbi:hypothetical protein ADUPG1_011373, partial [Aduncisulcus paluster]